LTSAQLPEQRRRAALRVARLENAPDDLCERVTCAAPIAPIRDYSLRLMFKKERKEGEKKWGGKIGGKRRNRLGVFHWRGRVKSNLPVK